MSFVMLPPEVNSGRMYAGAGPGPLLAAASAWDGLATELYSTAEHCGAVISGLTAGPWSGPAADRMAAAAAPQMQWLTSTAGQAERIGAQAKAAASAYAQAYAMTVPPPVIAANRAQYQLLVATNFVGQNSPAIAATEAQYAEYWAQDGEAMDGYAANSTAATQSLSTQQFTPMAATSDGGLAQTAAVGSAQAQSAYAAGQQLLPSLQQALGGLTSPAQSSAGLIQGLEQLFQLPTVISEPLGDANAFGGLLTSFGTLPAIVGTIWGVGATNWGIMGASAAAAAAAEAATISEVAPVAAAALPEATLAAATASAATASADLGQSSVVGGLSVPPSWADTAPALRAAAAALPTTSMSAAASGGMPLFSGAPLATVAGRGVGGSFSGSRRQKDPRSRRTAGDAGGRRT